MPKCDAVHFQAGQAIAAAVFLLLSCMIPAMAALPPEGPMREWTFSGGVATRAALQTFDGTTAVVRLSSGGRASVTADTLSEADRAWLAEWQERQPVVIPDLVGVESSKVLVEVVSEDEANGKFVYRTQHFEFTSDGKLTQNLLRDVARNFEATRELVKTLPWGIDPQPEAGDRFRALLVRSRERYKQEGGAPNSGGIYFSSRKLFIVPFESLGIERLGKSFTKSTDYRSDTLVHEITHQMMHASLDFLPQWVIEGTAEYTNAIPLRVGVFRVSAARTGLRDYIASLKSRGGVPEPFPIEELFGISGEKWSETLAKNPDESLRMYFTAYLLVNYFMHMDGKGDGARFAKYMRAVEKYRHQVGNRQNSAGKPENSRSPGDFANGRPPSLDITTPPPERRAGFEKSTLDILLDGRKITELMDQIRSAYRRVGIKL